ncbi:MAG: KpsF/GutQ family sugar-phosphate isomerase [Gammaproteobacteria bacterium]|nr:KpsF/GutQ family sugar-phosphate isomerase [Gammaproteobacteria bacterium]
MSIVRTEDYELTDYAQEVIRIEYEAVSELKNRIDQHFVDACRYILNCRGRVVVTGMGKSGHIAGKIAATLASTGSPAFFVHPGEACHGDLGMITPEDVMIALSNSGETSEVLTILPLIKRLAIPMIAMTGNAQSTLALQASSHLDVSVRQEACPLGLAPTSSSTAALVMGDAIAVALLKVRKFTRDDFALSHPGGSLGKRLLLTVKDLMHCDKELPMVSETAMVSDALLEMTDKKLGMTAIVDENRIVKGVFTDGDLRRMFKTKHDIHHTLISEVMVSNCQVVRPEVMAAEALQLMEQRKINALLVVDEQSRLVGALNMHDLMRSGVF